jgi:hypothetical protein
VIRCMARRKLNSRAKTGAEQAVDGEDPYIPMLLVSKKARWLPWHDSRVVGRLKLFFSLKL